LLDNRRSSFDRNWRSSILKALPFISAEVSHTGYVIALVVSPITLGALWQLERIGLLATVLSLIAALIWVVVLRRRVGRQTEFISRQLATEASSREAAQSADHAKSEFLASISHEIRTPMNGILGIADLALETELNREQREYVSLVKTSAESLLIVISDILDLSKIEADTFELESTEFSLRQTVNTAIKTKALEADQKRLELLSEVGFDVPDGLVGDNLRVRQILLSLVGNSIESTDSGEVLTRIELESRDEEKQEVCLHFSVSDTGSGIAPEKQNVFDVLVRADSSGTHTYGGIGLGLAISAKYVSMMGGEIWVESKPGNGSVVHFTARFGVAKEPSRTCESTTLINMAGAPVLVVDDNATNRRLLRDMLINWRMKPIVAESGEAALAALRKTCESREALPLVLLDAHMPDMDGFAVAEEIKKTPEFAGSTLIMLTSSGRTSDAARCRALGVAAYLTKPLSQASLLEAITGALGASPLAGGANSIKPSCEQNQAPLKILLAEDNPVNQQLVVTLLEKRGHSVAVADNGRLAVERLEAESFDLILMDVQMPEMDGLEATAAIRLREQAGSSRIPIIAMTAYNTKREGERCFEAGMDGYVSKPISVEALLRVIRNLLSGYAKQDRGAEKRRPGMATVSADQVLDRSELLAFLDGDVQFLRRMVQAFFKTCDESTSHMREAIAAGDAKKLDDAAHFLKGAAGHMKGTAVVSAILTLEENARSGELGKANEQFRALEWELTKLKLALTEMTSDQATHSLKGALAD